MAEVLIGFMILALMLGSFSKIISVANNMLFTTRDIYVAQRTLQEEFFKKNHGMMNREAVSPTPTFTLTEVDYNGTPLQDGASLTLDAEAYEYTEPDDMENHTELVLYQIRKK